MAPGTDPRPRHRPRAARQPAGLASASASSRNCEDPSALFVHHKVKSGSGAGGGGARRRRVGKGAPRFLAQCQPLEVAPSIFNPLGVMGRTSWVLGQGDTVGQTPTGTGASSYPPTHHCVPNPRKCGAELGARRHPGGGGGDDPRRTLSTDRPSFLRSPTISSSPRPGC